MHASFKTTRTFCALALAAFLAACGGGGGGSSTPAATPATPATPSTPAAPPADIVPSGGTLQSSAGSDTYAANSTAKQAFDQINLARLGAGAGQMNQAAQIDTAAGAHASYVTTNLSTMTDLHTEESNKSGFYDVSPAMRIAKAGFVAGLTTEDIGGTGPSLRGEDCINGLLNTVYHAASLLSPFTKIGVGIGMDAASAPICVINAATTGSDTIGQVPASGSVVQYPYPGQVGVLDTFYVAYEVPRPSATLFPGTTAGTPVIVSLKNADWVNFQNAGTLNAVVTKFSLKDSGGNVIPAHILAGPNVTGSGVTLNADPLLPAGFLVLVPQSPLPKNAFYTAELTASLKTGTTAMTKLWQFATNP